MRAIHTILTMPGDETEEIMTRNGVSSPSPTRWTGPAKEVLSAYAELRRRGIQCYLLHDFEPGDSDRPENYGALLSLIPEDAVDLREDIPLLIGTEDESSSLANRPLLDLLAPVTKGVEWTPREDGILWELLRAPRLPEPVSLLTVFSKEQGSTGRWMISHDGRRVLTARNLEFLRECGIAWTDSEEVEGQVYPVPSSLVFGGRVVEVLVSHGVEFSDPPIHLIDRAAADAVATGEEEGRS
ncbi:hypothetical protein [Streptomyces sp. NPDC050759]|uniref:hypothetical protein n=1 Tax=Streptomyces sp. NPDC050759 TaxID=3365635 RepID=UPI00378E4F58